VHLDVIEGSVGLCPLMGVTRISIHVPVGEWGTTVTEEGHDLVSSLPVCGEIIPEHCGILKVGLRVALLGVDEERELRRITDEEDRRVVKDPIPVALLSVIFDRETSRVSCSIWGTLFATNC